MTESQLEQDVFDYLLKLGFPKSNIIHHPSFAVNGKLIRPDFALLTSTTRRVIAIIEVKSARSPLSAGFEQLRHYLSGFKYGTVRAFLVVPGSIAGEFDFYSVGEGEEPKKVDRSFLNYASLETAAAVEKVEEVSQEKRIEADTFRRLCFGLASMAAILVIADVVISKVYCFALLNSERLYLILALVVLLVIPFFQRFKIFGWEAERYEQALKKKIESEGIK